MRRFLLFLFGLTILEACDWIDSIKDKKVKIELSGNGLHRKLKINSHLASLKRFSDCRILYEFTLPPGAYIDSNLINASLSKHSVHSKHNFDVEAPMSRSESHKILILSQSRPRKNFLIDDELELPIQIRYHSANEGETKLAHIVFTSPTLALDCPSDFVSSNLVNCKGKSYDVSSLSPKWILIEPLEKSTVRASIPVGDRSQLNLVLGVTSGALLLGLCVIFSS